MAPAAPARFIATGSFSWFDRTPPPAPENSVGARNGPTLRVGLLSGPSTGTGRMANIHQTSGRRRGTGRACMDLMRSSLQRRVPKSWFNPTTAHQFLRILGSMRISGAFLAEKTSAVDNKLDVQGGVISNYKVGRDRLAKFDIVVLTQGDTGGADRLVVIEVSPPAGEDGEPLHLHRELPMNLTNADVGFVCFQFNLALNVNGRWTVAMKGAAGEVSLPLTVSGPLPRNKP